MGPQKRLVVDVVVDDSLDFVSRSVSVALREDVDVSGGLFSAGYESSFSGAD